MRVRHRNSERGDVDYYYDDNAVIEEHKAGDNSLLAHYRYADRLLSLETTVEVQYYHHDVLGSTVDLTDSLGSIKVTYRLDAWGHIRQQVGDSVNRQIFTGQEHDLKTGLIYFGARFYDPDTARFLTQDSYLGEQGTPPSLDRYLYAYSNPTVYVDLEGYSSETTWESEKDIPWGTNYAEVNIAGNTTNPEYEYWNMDRKAYSEEEWEDLQKKLERSYAYYQIKRKEGIFGEIGRITRKFKAFLGAKSITKEDNSGQGNNEVEISPEELAKREEQILLDLQSGAATSNSRKQQRLVMSASGWQATEYVLEDTLNQIEEAAENPEKAAIIAAAIVAERTPWGKLWEKTGGKLELGKAWKKSGVWIKKRLGIAPKSIGAKTWQQYEKGIRGLYGDVPFSARQYQAIVDGKLVSGVADNVVEIAGKRVAIEAKFVKGDWSKSIRNSKSPVGSKPFAIAEQQVMIDQAKKYTTAFDEVIYHSNSPELISYYTNVFQQQGITNFKFILTQ